MLFRRRQTDRATGPSGPVQHGLDAVLSLERRIGSVMAATESVYGSEHRSHDEKIFRRSADAVAYACARVATGQRATAIIPMAALPESLPGIIDAVARRLPVVVHVLSEGPWESVFHAGSAGAIVLAASDVRDATALTAAAHRAAEETLLPVLCILDARRVAHACADIAVGEAAAVETLFTATRPSADATQRLAFGTERPAIPSWIDPDRPMGLGSELSGMDRNAATAARLLLLDVEVGASVDRALSMASDVCGRHLDPVVVQGSEQAPVTFVTTGPSLPVPSARSTGYRVLSCIRLFPFPLEAVLARIGRTRATLLLPVAPGSYASRLAAAIGRTPGRSVPVGLLPDGFEPDLRSDLEHAARLLDADALPDPYFPAVWRPADRPGLPEAERLEQRLRAGFPAFERALLTNRSLREQPVPAGPGYIVFAGDTLGPLAEAELASTLTDVTSLAVRSFSLRTRGSGQAVAVSLGSAAATAPEGRAFAVAVEHAADLDRYGLFDLLGASTTVTIAGSDDLSAEATVRLRAAGALVRRLNPGAKRADPSHPLASALMLVASTALPETAGPQGPLTASIPSETARRLVARLSTAGHLPDEHADLLLAQIDSVSSIETDVPPAPSVEPMPPSVIRGATADTDRIDDPLRFWRSVGFAHASGRASELVPDPYRAIGALPARAGWAPTGGGHPSALPSLIAERCTGCGDCWTICPESALVPVAPTFEQVLDAAFEGLEKTGEQAFQLGRLRKALAQEIYRTFRSDAIHQFTTLDALVGEALERVLIKGKVDEEKRGELLVEFATLSTRIPRIPVARTEAWFDKAESTAKGSGRPMMLAVDPDRCSSCGLCIVACSETALEPTAPSRSENELARAGASFCRSLPTPPDDVRLASGLSRTAAQAFVSGGTDAVSTGDDATLATIHASTLAAEAVIGEARSALVRRMGDARSSLEDATRKIVSAAVEINDFEAFGKRLAALGDRVDSDRLLASVSSESSIDARRLGRLTGAQQQLVDLERSWAAGDSGRGRAGVVAILEGEPDIHWPINPFGFPWMRVTPGSGAAAVMAVADELERRHQDEINVIRSGERVSRDVETDAGAIVPTFDQLEPSERAACPVPLLITDRLTDGILTLLDAGRRVRVLLLSRDPMGAGDPALAAAALGSAVVVQGTLGRPRELADGLAAAFAHDGPALIHCLAPSGPVASAFIRSADAVVARVFPLFRFTPPTLLDPLGTFDLAGNPSIDADWSARGQDPISWLNRDDVATRSWRITPRGEEPKGLLTPHDFLTVHSEDALTPGQVVGLPRSGGRTAIVPTRVLDAARRRLTSWRRLRAMTEAARSARPAAAVAATTSSSETAPVPAAPTTVVALPAEVHARLTSRLLALSGFAPGDPRAADSLRKITGGSPQAETVSESDLDDADSERSAETLQPAEEG